MGKSSEIRGTWKQQLTGKVVVLLMRMLGSMVRFRINDPYGCKAKSLDGEVMIWAFWHNCLFSAPLAWNRIVGDVSASALASASKDGAVVASVIKNFKVDTIRGSSSRRGASALIAMRQALRDGEQIVLTPDGPRGPVCRLQPGAIKLAQVSSVPIVSLHFSYSSSWRLRSWDRFHIPKPFSTVTIDICEPVVVPRDLDENNFESLRKKVEDALGVETEVAS